MKQTVLLLLTVAALCSESIAQPGDSSSIEQRFEGAWDLESWNLRLEDGSTVPHRWSLGSIIYSDSVRMCWIGMEPDRPRWPDSADPTDSQIVEAFQGVASCCARVEVFVEDGFVLHHVDFGQNPNDPGIIRMGAELGPVEADIYAELIQVFWSSRYWTSTTNQRLGAGSNVSIHDFAAFLYENPGARRVWEAEMAAEKAYREQLVGAPIGEELMNIVLSDLDKMEE